MNATHKLLMTFSCTLAIAACGGSDDPKDNNGNTGNTGNTGSTQQMSPAVQKSCKAPLTKEDACGGENVKGEWKLGAICDSPKEVAERFTKTINVTQLCAEAKPGDVTMSHEDVTLKVTDNSFKQTGKLVINVPYNLPKSCLGGGVDVPANIPGLGAGDLDATKPENICKSMSDAMAESAGEGYTANCTYADDNCGCVLSVEVPLKIDTNYTASGANGLSMSLPVGGEGEVLYCADGDNLASQIGVGAKLLGDKALKAAWERVK